MDALNWLFLGAAIFCMVLMTVTGLRGIRLARVAYAAGLIAGLRQARELVRDRASVAIELMPAGQLQLAWIRVQMAHQIEADLDEAIGQVRP